MSSSFRFRRFLAAALAVAATGLLSVRHAGAEIADIAQVPLANSPSDAVLPNLMFLLDDSGSMAWNYMPDQIFRTSSGDIFNNCKRCTTTSCSGPGGTGSNGFQCGNDQTDPDTASNTAPTTYGEAPFYAYAFNKIWYNPNITYAPGVDLPGHEPRQRQPDTARARRLPGRRQHQPRDRLQGGDLLQHRQPHGRGPHQPAKCRKNGIHNVTPSSRGDELLPLLGHHGQQRRPAEDGLSTTRSSSTPRTRTTSTSRRTSTAATRTSSTACWPTRPAPPPAPPTRFPRPCAGARRRPTRLPRP